MRSVDEKLFIAQLVENPRDSITEAGAATNNAIDALARSISEAARNPETVFYPAQIHQVWGRRPK